MTDDGPFTDAVIKHYAVSVQTHRGIVEAVEAVEAMAQILAAAGRASSKVTGDCPQYAVERWSDIIKKRALELLSEDPPSELKQKLLGKLQQMKKGDL